MCGGVCVCGVEGDKTGPIRRQEMKGRVIRTCSRDTQSHVGEAALCSRPAAGCIRNMRDAAGRRANAD